VQRCAVVGGERPRPGCRLADCGMVQSGVGGAAAAGATNPERKSRWANRLMHCIARAHTRGPSAGTRTDPLVIHPDFATTPTRHRPDAKISKLVNKRQSLRIPTRRDRLNHAPACHQVAGAPTTTARRAAAGSKLPARARMLLVPARVRRDERAVVASSSGISEQERERFARGVVHCPRKQGVRSREARPAASRKAPWNAKRFSRPLSRAVFFSSRGRAFLHRIRRRK